jgi:hypothetical protein
MGGGGKYEFTNVNSEITCTGIASRPDKVPFNLIGCEGQSGLANGVCSDGKKLNMRWYASTSKYLMLALCVPKRFTSLSVC